MMTSSNKRQKYDLGLMLQKYRGKLNQKYNLSIAQEKVIGDLIKCRTAETGGHALQCTSCGHKQHAYNSCRNRHCPKCQHTKQVQWVDKLKSSLPATRYYHIVFTIPQSLHSLFYTNQASCYDLLLKTAALTIKQVAKSKNGIGADVGGISLLHTWGQALTYHPHVHMLVPAGGLSEDRMEWVYANKKFFVPVRVLSKVFRGILCKNLEKELYIGNLFLSEGTLWKDLKNKLYQKDWNVYVKPAMAGPEKVLEYLGRYTHRVAISNERITKVADEQVTFRIKNYRRNSLTQNMELPVLEFLRRFLQHVLPSGFYKIRYFGFLANIKSGEMGKQIMALLEQCPLIPEFEGLSASEIYGAITGISKRNCPVCQLGRLVLPHLVIPPS
jgi:hypothetical protein